MHKKITDKRGAFLLSLLVCTVYGASYLTRINYTAIIAEIVERENLLKTTAGFVTTAGFISYGIGQLISGFLGDRLNPVKLIFIGLFSTSVFNLFMPFCQNVSQMTLLWFLNGFAQAMLWPPLLKIMIEYLERKHFIKACVNTSVAVAISTISIYVLSPLIIKLSGWKSVFFICSAAGFLVSFTWIWAMSKISRYAQKHGEEIENTDPTVSREKIGSFWSVFLSSGMLMIIAGAVIHGILRDGMTTWMPSYILETFNMDSSMAILITVTLPIFSILSNKFIAFIQQKLFENELSCAAILYLTAFISTVFMTFLYSFSALVSVILAGIVIGCMHGINLMLVCLVPGRFEKYGSVSYISGMLNFFTYVGSALSTYGFAKLSVLFGWQYAMLAFSAVALIGTLMMFFCVKRWALFKKSL